MLLALEPLNCCHMHVYVMRVHQDEQIDYVILSLILLYATTTLLSMQMLFLRLQ
jgi:hypothetical protein